MTQQRGTSLTDPASQAETFARSSSLPVPLTSLIGRDGDIDRVIGLVHAGTRLVTLTGPGGVGKTRLALAIGERLGSDFADGASFVDLSGLTDPTMVPDTVLRALGARPRPGVDAATQLVEHLGGSHLLVILDNYEHLLGASPAWLASVLRAVPRASMLVTSRVPLGLDGEQRYRVEPLPVDVGTEAVGAVRLFVERARSRDPGFASDARQAAGVAEICRRLDGLPLAIELAAARSSLLSIEEILARLDRPTELLRNDRRDGPARHRSLQQAISWSYDLLSPGARQLLRRLAVFEGGAPLDAVGHVMAVTDALALVEELVDHSLVQPRHGDSGATRYEMLATVREFALEQLAALREEANARDAHADWVRQFSKDVFRDNAVGRYRPYLDRVVEEIWNLEAGSAWLLQQDRVEDFIDIAVETAVFRHLRGLVPHHREVFERFLEHPRLAEPGPARGKALMRFGASLFHAGENRRAQEILEAARQMLERFDEPFWQSEAAMFLGFAYRSSGDLARARWAMEKAYPVRTGSGLDAYAAGTLLNLGVVAMLEGDLDEAERLELEGRERSLALGEEWYVGYADLWLGHIAMERGEDERAETLLRESRRAFDALGNILDVPKVDLALARLAMRRNDHVAAQASLHSALAAAQTIGQTEYIGEVSLELGRLAVRQMELGSAATHLREALRHFRAMEQEAGLSETFRAIAELADAASMRERSVTLRATAGEVGHLLRTSEVTGEAGQRAARSDFEAAVASADAVAAEVERTGFAGRAEMWGLSDREREVLRLVAEGLTNQEIAEVLFVSNRTIGSHIDHILTKLGVRSRTAAVAFAIRNGLA